MTITPTFTIGDRLRKARETAQLDQNEMAALLKERGFKAGRSAVGNWENEHSQPRRFMDLIDAWAEITGVDSAWLLTGVSPGQGANQNWKFLNTTGTGRGTFRLTPAA